MCKLSLSQEWFWKLSMYSSLLLHPQECQEATLWPVRTPRFNEITQLLEDRSAGVKQSQVQTQTYCCLDSFDGFQIALPMRIQYDSGGISQLTLPWKPSLVCGSMAITVQRLSRSPESTACAFDRDKKYHQAHGAAMGCRQINPFKQHGICRIVSI